MFTGLAIAIVLAKGSISSPHISTSRPSYHYSAPAPKSTPPKVSTPKPAAPKSTPKPAPKTTPKSSTPAKPKAVKPEVKKPTPTANRVNTSYANSAGQTVVYRDSGMNWFTTYLMFGWLWHQDKDDKCFDANNKEISCDKKDDKADNKDKK